MIYPLCYVMTLVIFGAFDAVWLTSMSGFYRGVLGESMLQSLRMAPAVIFYLMYPVGIIIFALAPALKSESALEALTYGALFGLFAYAAYDLTNFATLRNWNWSLTLIDAAWGTFATGVAATLAYFAVTWVAPKLGIALHS